MSETDIALRGSKIAGIIEALSDLYNISIMKATNIYYSSDIAKLIEDKVADLHCRSNKYLAALVWEEYIAGDETPPRTRSYTICIWKPPRRHAHKCGGHRR